MKNKLIRYVSDNGTISYLLTDGTFTLDLSVRDKAAGVFYATFSRTETIDGSIECEILVTLKDAHDFLILWVEDIGRIFEKFSKELTNELEKILLDENEHLIDLNVIRGKVGERLNVYANTIITDRKKELSLLKKELTHAIKESDPFKTIRF